MHKRATNRVTKFEIRRFKPKFPLDKVVSEAGFKDNNFANSKKQTGSTVIP